jgi:hypothetical protein
LRSWKTRYGIRSVPAVVVDGKLADCCTLDAETITRGRHRHSPLNRGPARQSGNPVRVSNRPQNAGRSACFSNSRRTLDRSLVLFVLALRGLGTARTGAYFSIAPFVGAAVALALLGESTSPAFWIAAGLMAFGVWLHLTEHHEHEHVHEPLAHAHGHVHDEHHQHAHDFEWDGSEPHDHSHRHATMTHKHPHFPDIHHRHSH